MVVADGGGSLGASVPHGAYVYYAGKEVGRLHGTQRTGSLWLSDVLAARCSPGINSALPGDSGNGDKELVAPNDFD